MHQYEHCAIRPVREQKMGEHEAGKLSAQPSSLWRVGVFTRWQFQGDPVRNGRNVVEYWHYRPPALLRRAMPSADNVGFYEWDLCLHQRVRKLL